MRLACLAALLAVGCSTPEAAPEELYNRLLNVRSLAFSPDGKTLVAGRSQGALLVWEGDGAMKEVPAHDGDVVGLAFVGDELVSAGANGELKYWKPDFTASRTLTSQRWIWTMQPCGSTLAVLRAGGRTTYQPRKAEIQLWEASLKRSFPVPDATSMAASSSLLATALTGPGVVLWGPDGARVRELATTATALDFSPDGQTLACGGPDGTVTLYDSASGKATALTKLPSRVIGLRYAPDGRLAAGCEGHLVLCGEGKVLWDRQVDSYASPSVLAFSPDGSRLATAGASKVLLWSGL